MNAKKLLVGDEVFSLLIDVYLDGLTDGAHHILRLTEAYPEAECADMALAVARRFVDDPLAREAIRGIINQRLLDMVES